MTVASGYSHLSRRRVLFLDNAGNCIFPRGVVVVPPAQLQEFQTTTSAMLRAGHVVGCEDPNLAHYSCPIPVTLRPLAGKRRLQGLQQQEQQHQQHDHPAAQCLASQCHLVPPRKQGGRGEMVSLLNSSDSEAGPTPSDIEGSAVDTLQGLAFWLNQNLWMVTLDVPDQSALPPDSQWHQLETQAQLEQFVKSPAGRALFDRCRNANGPSLAARRVFLCRVSDNAILNASSELANHCYPGATLPRVDILLQEARSQVFSTAIHNAFNAGRASCGRSMPCCDGRVDRAVLDNYASAASSSSGGTFGHHQAAVGVKGAIFCPCRTYHVTKGSAVPSPSYLLHFFKDEYLVIEWRGVSRTTPGPDASAPAPKPALSPRPPVSGTVSGGSTSSAWHVSSPLLGKGVVARAAEAQRSSHQTLAHATLAIPSGSRIPNPHFRVAAGKSAGAPAASCTVAARGATSRVRARGGGTGGGSVQKRKAARTQSRRASAAAAGSGTAAAAVPLICDECGATESCVWRQDPQRTPRRLCNACGLRVSRYQRKIRRLDAMIAATSSAANAAPASSASAHQQPVAG